MHFTGTTVLKVIDGKIVEGIGLDDGLTALTQLGLIKAVALQGTPDAVTASEHRPVIF